MPAGALLQLFDHHFEDGAPNMSFPHPSTSSTATRSSSAFTPPGNSFTSSSLFRTTSFLNQPTSFIPGVPAEAPKSSKLLSELHFPNESLKEGFPDGPNKKRLPTIPELGIPSQHPGSWPPPGGPIGAGTVGIPNDFYPEHTIRGFAATSALLQTMSALNILLCRGNHLLHEIFPSPGFYPTRTIAGRGEEMLTTTGGMGQRGE